MRSQSRSNTFSSLPATRRALTRSLRLCSLLSLLAACGSPSEGGDAVEPSPVDEAGAEAFGSSPAERAELAAPTSAASILRTRSTKRGLEEADKRLALNHVGTIEHTFSNGRKSEFIISEHGNFGIGDIILGGIDEMPAFIEQEESGVQVRGIGTTSGTWADSTVRYKIDSNIAGADRTAVEQAITSWNADAPVVRWALSDATVSSYARFVKSSSTEFCGRSRVGKGLFGGQDIEIVCFNRDTILHEMGHATGLEHEHTRCGRNAFVSIHADSTGKQPDSTNYGENCGSSRKNYGDYDFASLMHYRRNAFLDPIMNPGGLFLGLPSMIRTTNRLSQNDVNSINQMYTGRTTAKTSGYAFAWSSALTGTVDAHSGYSHNSAKLAAPHATVSKISTGRYNVRFPSLGSEVAGNVQVTAYGGDSNRCKVEQWNSATNVDVTVRCNTAQGVLADSLFAVSYDRVPSPTGGGWHGGHLYSNRLKENGAYTPDPWYQWNSAGKSNRVTWLATGVYQVEFPGIAVTGGTVRLTAFGANSDYCSIGGWGSESVTVNCFGTTGVAKDSAFSIALQENGFPGTYAWAWANDPTSPSYDPASFYQRAVIVGDAGGTQPTPIHVDRQGVGDYKLTIPGVPDAGTTVNVSAYATNNSCKVSFWVPGTPVGPGLAGRREQVFVRCFAPNGSPADSLFAISYFSKEIVIG